MKLESDDANQATARVAMTVSALNRVVAGSLLRNFPLVRVAGEICNFSRAASGHWYFGLKDAAAQVRCVMFRGRNALVPSPVRDGESVEVLAQVTLYEPRGEFQLVIESLQRGGLGRLYERFVQLRDRLAGAGLFDAAIKRSLPRFPRHIAVVTSLQAAALRDVLVALQRRAPYLQVTVCAAPVQGEGAADRLAAALGTLSARGGVDVVLLVRGGGSLEDLWAFNEEVLARAIRASVIPVVTGIGHESDITIADLAADLRAPTPTAAAELVAPAQRELAERIDANLRLLARRMRATLGQSQQRLDYAQRAAALPGNWLRASATRVADVARRLDSGFNRMRHRVESRYALLAQRATALRRLPDRRRTAVTACQQRLQSTVEQGLAERAARLQRLAQGLDHLDPQRVLERGYAIVFDARRHAITEAANVAAGARLGVQLARGALSVDVHATHVRALDEGTWPPD